MQQMPQETEHARSIVFHCSLRKLQSENELPSANKRFELEVWSLSGAKVAVIPAWYDSRTFLVNHRVWAAAVDHHKRQGHRPAPEYQPGYLDDRYQMFIKAECEPRLDFNDLPQQQMDLFFGDLLDTLKVEVEEVKEFNLAYAKWESLFRGGELTPISSSESSESDDT